MSALEQSLADLVRRTVENGRWRQSRAFNLIPSETTPSLLVKLCEIADPAGRYAEHRTLKGREIYFYQGTDFIESVEEEARREICRFFACSEAELRPISGQMANEVVFKALLRWKNAADPGAKKLSRLKLVVNNELTSGGHLSAQPMGALFNFVDVDAQGNDCVVHFPLRHDNAYQTDVDQLAEILHARRPELIVFGKSLFLYPEPVREVSALVQSMNPRPVIHYDMAHVLGLYGAFQAPLAEGADIVTGSTHKTFFGPQRGLIVSNLSKDSPLRKLWLEVKGRAFPGSTSNHHLGTLLGLTVAAHEMNAFKADYQDAVLSNARALARSLDAAGLHVEGRREDGFTHTHQVVLRVRAHGSGEEVARRLEQNNILVNYQALPDDTSFIDSSGIRLGVQEMTRFGMQAPDFERLAGFIADAVLRRASVATEVAKERQRFLDMRYCLPKESAVPLAADILATLLPAPGDAQRFATALQAVAGANIS